MRAGLADRHRETGRQLLRYGIVGVINNGIGYSLYLLFTALGGPPKLTMTCLYLVGTALSFIGNRAVVFAHRGHWFAAALRHTAVYGAGYFINLGLMLWLVDRLGYPHQLVQLFATFVVAAFLFVTLKLFVFRRP